MPIEIRELIIRANVEEANSIQGLNNSSRGGSSISFSEKEAIIAACIEQVMKMLEEKKER